MAMTTETMSPAGLAAAGSHRLATFLDAVRAWIRLRNTLNLLDKLDEHALRDVGLSRDDLIDLRLASSLSEVLASARRRPRW